MIKIKDLTSVLLKEKNLYDECGKIFKYLAEVRINFSSLIEHNVPWQMSQIIEIIYSNKLDGNNIQIYDGIIGYSTNYDGNLKAKSAAWANFEATYYVSKLRKEKTTIDLSSIEKIIEIIHANYGVEKNDDSTNFLRCLNEESISILKQMLNGKFSNNPLYFFPLFLFIIEEPLKKIKCKNVVRSVLLNLYLMKNKLLFAPTLCFTYPLFFNYDEYIKLIDEIKEDKNKIIAFSRFIFDLINQAAVVSRAFISDFSKVNSNLKVAYENNPKLFKNIPINSFLRIISINERILMESLELKNTKKPKEILNYLHENGYIMEIATLRKQKIYMYKEFLQTVKKLNKNKTEKTTKIFVLKENLN